MAVQPTNQNRFVVAEFDADADIGAALVNLTGFGPTVFGYQAPTDGYNAYNRGDVLIAKNGPGGATNFYRVTANATGTGKVAILMASTAGAGGPPDIVYVVANPLKYTAPTLSGYVYATIDLAVAAVTAVGGASIFVLDGSYAAPTLTIPNGVTITGVGIDRDAVVIDITLNPINIAARCGLANMSVVGVGGGAQCVTGPAGYLFADNCTFIPGGVSDAIDVGTVEIRKAVILTAAPGRSIVAPAANNIIDEVQAFSLADIGGGVVRDSSLESVSHANQLVLVNTDVLQNSTGSGAVAFLRCENARVFGATSAASLDSVSSRFTGGVTLSGGATQITNLDSCQFLGGFGSNNTTSGIGCVFKNLPAILTQGGGKFINCEFERYFGYADGVSGTVQVFDNCDLNGGIVGVLPSDRLHMKRCRVMIDDSGAGGAYSINGTGGEVIVDGYMAAASGIDPDITVSNAIAGGIADSGPVKRAADLVGGGAGSLFVQLGDTEIEYTGAHGGPADTIFLPPAEYLWDGYEIMVCCTRGSFPVDVQVDTAGGTYSGTLNGTPGGLVTVQPNTARTFRARRITKQGWYGG